RVSCRTSARIDAQARWRVQSTGRSPGPSSPSKSQAPSSLKLFLGGPSLGGLAHAAHGGRARLHGGVGIVVAADPTQLALQSLADRALVEIGPLPLRQVHGGHDHAGGAEAALQAVILAEGLLHRV